MTEDEKREIEALAGEDARVRFARFEHDDALAVGQRIIALARERGLTIAASVWLGQQLVFHGALAGTSADNDGWMIRKVATVRRYDASSQLVRRRWATAGVTTASEALGLDPLVYTLSGGAVPIRIGATQVGVVVASGVDDEVEHALVVEALKEHLALSGAR
ncbi:heme-degrading domain-containing protein [Microbacterium indicum]|uniref:heme-degrading domain-containing protein n=1 Tax=Microbacterium indicum TaxID=358100 RepID=UPI00040C3FCB|nr:heme-binding protein [Microbacterium indicum]